MSTATTLARASRPPPRLVIQMSGAPGSGKSSIAKKLAKSVNGVVLDHDTIKSSLLAHDIPFGQAAKPAYSLEWALSKDLIEQGWNVILDSPCNYQEIIDHGTALAQESHSVYWYVECKVEDVDVLDTRLRARDPARSQRTAVDQHPASASGARDSQDPRELFEKWIKHPCRPDHNVITVDSTGNLDQCRDYILEQIFARANSETSGGGGGT